MTNVRRPLHLQLRPANHGHLSPLSPKSGEPLLAASSPTTPSISFKAPPASDSLPSPILPHLFVGNQEQTNGETLDRLNISHILSLGLLPLVSGLPPTAAGEPISAQHMQPDRQRPSKGRPAGRVSMPSQNSSRDFRIKLRTSQSSATTPTTISTTTTTTAIPTTSCCPMAACQSAPHTPSGGGEMVVGESATLAGEHHMLAHQLAASAANQQSPGACSMRDNKAIRMVRSIKCKCINIADSSESSLAKFFDEALQFIDEARRKKCNILVHCLAGISRSPTIAIAYLMQVNSLRLQDAYNYVKRCRPQIEPNLNFVGQLMKYERCLKERIRLRSLQLSPLKPSGPSIPEPNGPMLANRRDEASGSAGGSQQAGGSDQTLEFHQPERIAA